jgi:hypothetical protein
MRQGTHPFPFHLIASFGSLVTPAEAGVHSSRVPRELDSGVRRNDDSTSPAMTSLVQQRMMPVFTRS